MMSSCLLVVIAAFAACWGTNAQMPAMPMPDMMGNMTMGNVTMGNMPMGKMMYSVPLMPAAGNDNVTFQRSATATLLNMFQVEVYVGPCAVRVPHYHYADEMILVANNTLGFVLFEANGSATDRQVPAGNIIELPRQQIHISYNPTCETTFYTAALNLAMPVTVVVPYLLNNAGNFSLEAIYSDEGRPQFRYANSAPSAQWAYNPACLAGCGIMLPSNLVDVDMYPMMNITAMSG